MLSQSRIWFVLFYFISTFGKNWVSERLFPVSAWKWSLNSSSILRRSLVISRELAWLVSHYMFVACCMSVFWLFFFWGVLNCGLIYSRYVHICTHMYTYLHICIYKCLFMYAYTLHLCRSLSALWIQNNFTRLLKKNVYQKKTPFQSLPYYPSLNPHIVQSRVTKPVFLISNNFV